MFLDSPLARSNQDSDKGDEVDRVLLLDMTASSLLSKRSALYYHISITESTEGAGKASVKTRGWNQNWGLTAPEYLFQINGKQFYHHMLNK